jgi:hypothetical protein
VHRNRRARRCAHVCKQRCEAKHVGAELAHVPDLRAEFFDAKNKAPHTYVARNIMPSPRTATVPTKLQHGEIRSGRRRHGRRMMRAQSPARAPPALPDCSAPSGSYHAWFSSKQYNCRLRIPGCDCHSAFYETLEGETVEVTAVTSRPDHGCKWDDFVYLGIVTSSSGRSNG